MTIARHNDRRNFLPVDGDIHSAWQSFLEAGPVDTGLRDVFEAGYHAASSINPACRLCGLMHEAPQYSEQNGHR